METEQKLMRDLMSLCIEHHIGFDYVNGVMTSIAFPNNSKVWYWFGNVRLAPKDSRAKGLTAGDMPLITGFSFDKDRGEFSFKVEVKEAYLERVKNND